MTTRDHYLIRHAYDGTNGDRPTPAEVTFTCGCGVELWEHIEGSAGTAGTPDDALQEHIEAVAVDDLARTLNAEGWTCLLGVHEPGEYDSCDDCADTCQELAQFLTRAELIPA